MSKNTKNTKNTNKEKTMSKNTKNTKNTNTENTTTKKGKILLKVVSHGKDALKCVWGAFVENTPLAEIEKENTIKAGRNIYLQAVWAKKYAEENGYKISGIIADAAENAELAAKTDAAEKANTALAEARKKDDAALSALLDCDDVKKRPALRAEWNKSTAAVEELAKDAKAANAAAIAESDTWFAKRVEAQSRARAK